jgi:hypothetical protein
MNQIKAQFYSENPPGPAHTSQKYNGSPVSTSDNFIFF